MNPVTAFYLWWSTMFLGARKSLMDIAGQIDAAE
jgi:hypothetical protein